MKKLLFLSGMLLLSAQGLHSAAVETNESRFDRIARQIAEMDEAAVERGLLSSLVNFGPSPYLSEAEIKDLKAIARALGKERIARWFEVETIRFRPTAS